ncbi:MAG: hypothetical protein MUO62_16585 [Anaerolineales bacterium]|nr:hypothetical protein [Anaerolineales bacterium]
MSLFFINHQHGADTCPARDPEMGNQLLLHISRMNAQKYGVHIVSDAVIDGEHTFVLLVEAADEKVVRQFMQPFAMAGTVDIKPASHCETVVERAGC